MRRWLLLGVTLLISGALARASPYWIAWEGNDFPENQGWERYWGDWQGHQHGHGADRTLQDGVLRYDSLFDDGVYDCSIMERPAQTDPGIAELFVAEWRLKTPRP